MTQTSTSTKSKKSNSADTNFIHKLTNVHSSEEKEFPSDELLLAKWDEAIRSVVSDMYPDPEQKKHMLDALGSSSLEESFDITPFPGFVLKTHLSQPTSIYPSQIKLFINLCHSPYVPAPPLGSDTEIRSAINGSNEGSSGWKVPMSLVGPRDEMDKLGRPCVVFDACVHSDVLTKSEHDADFKLFIMELAMEWVEEKHKMTLSRDFSTPKMKAKGTLATHKIFRPKRPAMQTMSPSTPLYTLNRYPTHLLLTIHLPLLTSSKQMTVDIEKSHVYLKHSLYTLSLSLPTTLAIHHPQCDACFDRTKKTLILHLPLSD